MTFEHKPVLLEEAIDLLHINKHGIYVDCTLGGGGHSSKILQRLNETGHLFSFDQDKMAIASAQKKFGNISNLTLIYNNFAFLAAELQARDIAAVDGILYDLGVSSPQLDVGERGFSYQKEAVLDMRMDINTQVTAQQVVNKLSEKELNKIFWEYGEERWAKRVAQFIIQYRRDQGINTTGELVSIIKKAIPKAARKEGPHPAKRIFQALRIYVNDELSVLQQSLEQAVNILKPGGRISIITFHSLEDRIVKQFIKDKTRGCYCAPQVPICVCGQQPAVRNLTKKPVIPSKVELENNPRARSAKLRGCEKR